MSQHSAENERVKRGYLIYLKAASPSNRTVNRSIFDDGGSGETMIKYKSAARRSQAVRERRFPLSTPIRRWMQFSERTSVPR
jgi:hypothetical protein